MAGDSLAAGAKTAQFRTGGGTLSEIAYNLRVLSEAEFREKYPEENYEKLIGYLRAAEEMQAKHPEWADAIGKIKRGTHE